MNVEFAKRLLSLARKGDKELLAAFEASFDNNIRSFQEHKRFDYNFFLDNATDIIREKYKSGDVVINPKTTLKR
jgi:hypothetical protein